MIAAIGHKKTARPAIKFRREAAEYTIFQGTITQPAVTVMRTTPLLMLMYLARLSVYLVEETRQSTYFGNKVVKSLDPLMTFADRLVPI
jgi:hypothetical protein